MTKELTKWADDFMFEAEPSHAADGPTAYLLSAPVDPLAGIAACAKMYKGEVVRDLRDVSNAEREEYLEQVQKTVLGMPLEAVTFHFMLEGVHRGVTHQMVRQRTAAYAQESTRFAVKRDMKDATALPPSLQDTLSLDKLAEQDLGKRVAMGLRVPQPQGREWDGANYSEVPLSAWTLEDQAWLIAHKKQVRDEALSKGGNQARRIVWDEMVDSVSEGYNRLIDDGMPAEEARGIMPTNITTRLNYITNLRNFLTEMSKRLSDQAQFEWRQVAAAYAKAMREFGRTHSYWTIISRKEYETWDDQGKYGPIRERGQFLEIEAEDGSYGMVQVRLSSQWQYDALTEAMKPIEFVYGRRAFGANFDRPSRIGERVDAYASFGIPSDQWLVGSPEHNIPAIHPYEWLGDPNSARLQANQEFDIFGQIVTKGTGWHWSSERGGVLFNIGQDGRVQYANLTDGPSYDIDDVVGEEVTS